MAHRKQDIVSEATLEQDSTLAVEDRDELDKQLAAQLVEHARAQGASLVGPDELLGKLTKMVFETALEAEMSEHLGYEPQRRGRNSGNSGNGSRAKTATTEIVARPPAMVGPDGEASLERCGGRRVRLGVCGQPLVDRWVRVGLGLRCLRRGSHGGGGEPLVASGQLGADPPGPLPRLVPVGARLGASGWWVAARHQTLAARYSWASLIAWNSLG